jgi:hypothetical protein
MDWSRRVVVGSQPSAPHFGVGSDEVKTILREIARDNVGTQGGKAAVDPERGYQAENLADAR